MQACQSLPMPGHHLVPIKLGFKVSPFPPSHFIAECFFEDAQLHTEEIAGCMFDETSKSFQVKLVLSLRIIFKFSQSINQFGTSWQTIFNAIKFILRGKLLFVCVHCVHFKSKHNLPNLQLSKINGFGGIC